MEKYLKIEPWWIEPRVSNMSVSMLNVWHFDTLKPVIVTQMHLKAGVELRPTWGDGGWAKKGKKIKSFFGTKKTQKTPSRAWCLKRLWLIRATPWADFVDIRVQLCLTIIEIFKCVAFSYKDCFHSVLDNCGLLTTPKEACDLNLSAVALRILSFGI